MTGIGIGSGKGLYHGGWRLILLSWLPVLVQCQTGGASGRLPSWVEQDCQLVRGAYHFVGFGQASHKLAALQQAREHARRTALVCLFGGSYAIQQQVGQSNQQAEFSAKVSQNLRVREVDWQGFQLVPGKIHVVNSKGGGRIQVHGLFRWQARQATAARTRYLSHQAELEQRRIQLAELESRQALMAEEQAALAQLSSQQEALAALKARLVQADERLEQSQRLQKERALALGPVMAKIPCGYTFGELVGILGQPDQLKVLSYGSKQSLEGAYWGQFLVEPRVATGYYRNSQDAMAEALAYRIATITPKYGHDLQAMRQPCG